MDSTQIVYELTKVNDKGLFMILVVPKLIKEFGYQYQTWHYKLNLRNDKHIAIVFYDRAQATWFEMIWGTILGSKELGLD